MSGTIEILKRNKFFFWEEGKGKKEKEKRKTNSRAP